jgi:hypothetical protein
MHMGLSSFIFEKLAKLQGGAVSDLFEYKRNDYGDGPPCNWGYDFRYAEPTVRQLSVIPTRGGKAKLHALTDVNYFGWMDLNYAHSLQRVELGELAIQDAQKILHRFNKICADRKYHTGYGEGVKLYEGYFKSLPEGTYTPVGMPDAFNWRTSLVRRLGSLECVTPEQRLPLVLKAMQGRVYQYAEGASRKRADRVTGLDENHYRSSAYYERCEAGRKMAERVAASTTKLEFTPPIG